jgi:hypothetical protein
MLLAGSPAVCARAVDHRPTTRLELHAVQEADKALAQAKQQQQSAAEDLMAVRARAQEDNKAAEDEAHKLQLQRNYKARLIWPHRMLLRRPTRCSQQTHALGVEVSQCTCPRHGRG